MFDLCPIREREKKKDSVPEKFQICPNLFRGASAPGPPSPRPMFGSIAATPSKNAKMAFFALFNC